MKINVTTDSVSDGASPSDEVHVSAVIGVKNDPGPAVTDIPPVRTENDCDWSAATTVGHCVDSDKPSDINEGSWLCPICNTDPFLHMLYESAETVYKTVE